MTCENCFVGSSSLVVAAADRSQNTPRRGGATRRPPVTAAAPIIIVDEEGSRSTAAKQGTTPDRSTPRKAVVVAAGSTVQQMSAAIAASCWWPSSPAIPSSSFGGAASRCGPRGAAASVATASSSSAVSGRGWGRAAARCLARAPAAIAGAQVRFLPCEPAAAHQTASSIVVSQGCALIHIICVISYGHAAGRRGRPREAHPEYFKLLEPCVLAAPPHGSSIDEPLLTRGALGAHAVFYKPGSRGAADLQRCSAHPAIATSPPVLSGHTARRRARLLLAPRGLRFF